MSLIELKNIYKTYTVGDSQRDVLKNINLKINPGELIAIVGASGSGKSTLMNIIGLLDQPSRGEYLLSGNSFHNLNADGLATIRNQQIGFVFQFFYLLPRLAAIENVMLPLLYSNVSPEQARQQAKNWLTELHLSHIETQKPSQLSGGQQQRVAIARALVTNPSLLLADEPTGALDSKTSEEIMHLFLDLHKRMGKTIIIVTHNPQVAEQCQRVIQLNDGEIIDDRKNR